MQFIGSVDIVFEQHGDSVKRTAYSALSALLIQLVGYGHRIGIYFQKRFNGRPVFVDFLDASQVSF